MPETCDVLVIGSGHNGLVAAAYLARAGLSVEVLERNPVAGGAVATEELTEPGFLHDTFSSWHPLFKLSAAFAELGGELGIQYCETPEATTANVRSDGAVTIAYRDAERTAEGFDPRDRAAYLSEMQSFGGDDPDGRALFGVELFSGQTPRLGWQLARQLGVKGGLSFAADMLSSARAWFETRFDGRDVSDLYSPWALHTGLAPGQRRQRVSGAGDRRLGARGRPAGGPGRRTQLRGRVRALDRAIRRSRHHRRRGRARARDRGPGNRRRGGRTRDRRPACGRGQHHADAAVRTAAAGGRRRPGRGPAGECAFATALAPGCRSTWLCDEPLRWKDERLNQRPDRPSERRRGRRVPGLCPGRGRAAPGAADRGGRTACDG